ncbi:MAG: tetratricopeptide repeat protein [Patescibacteria group bacterium]
MFKKIKNSLPFIIIGVVFVVLLGTFVWRSNTHESNFDWTKPDDLQLTPEQKVEYQEVVNKVQQDDQDVISVIELARLRDYGGDPDGSVKLYKKALDKKPNDTLAMSNLAGVYYSIGEYDQAEELYLKIIQFNPKWLNTYRDLADLYQYKMPEKYTSLGPILLNGLAMNPDNQREFVAMLAVFYKDIDNLQEAIKYYEQLVVLDPNNVAAAEELAEVRAKLTQ